MSGTDGDTARQGGVTDGRLAPLGATTAAATGAASGATTGAATGAASPRYGSAPTGVVYDALTADDAMECAALDLVLFGADGPWSAASFLSEIGSRHNRCFAARVNGELVGYAVLAALGIGSDREFEVHTIGVSAASQGLGIGRMLLRQMLDVVDAEGAPLLLDVRTDNMPARTMYESHGFEIVGLRPRYYRPSNADAYLMKREGRALPLKPLPLRPETKAEKQAGAEAEKRAAAPSWTRTLPVTRDNRGEVAGS